MEITLKKAGDYARELLSVAENIKIEPTRSIDVFGTLDDDSAADIIQAGRDKLTAAIEDVIEFVRAGYVIRALIGEANARSDVDRLLTEAAGIEVAIKRLGAMMETIDGVRGQSSPQSLVAALAATRTRFHTKEASFYGVGDAVTACFVFEGDKDLITDAIAAKRRRATVIREQIAGINLTTRVTLPDDVVEALRKAKVISRLDH